MRVITERDRLKELLQDYKECYVPRGTRPEDPQDERVEITHALHQLDPESVSLEQIDRAAGFGDSVSGHVLVCGECGGHPKRVLALGPEERVWVCIQCLWKFVGHLF